VCRSRIGSREGILSGLRINLWGGVWKEGAAEKKVMVGCTGAGGGGRVCWVEV